MFGNGSAHSSGRVFDEDSAFIDSFLNDNAMLTDPTLNDDLLQDDDYFGRFSDDINGVLPDGNFANGLDFFSLPDLPDLGIAENDGNSDSGRASGSRTPPSPIQSDASNSSNDALWNENLMQCYTNIVPQTTCSLNEIKTALETPPATPQMECSRNSDCSNSASPHSPFEVVIKEEVVVTSPQQSDNNHGSGNVAYAQYIPAQLAGLHQTTVIEKGQTAGSFAVNQRCIVGRQPKSTKVNILGPTTSSFRPIATKVTELKSPAEPVVANEQEVLLYLTAEQLSRMASSGQPLTISSLAGGSFPDDQLPVKRQRVAAHLNPDPQAIGLDSEDMLAIKRQQRMIRNRESACLSRKRRKDYLNSLEQKVNDLTTENASLAQQNQLLSDRFNQLQQENAKLRALTGLRGGSKVKSTTLMLALVFMVVLNFGSFGVLRPNQPELLQADPRLLQDSSLIHHGRSLLWKRGLALNDDITDDRNETPSQMYANLSSADLNQTSLRSKCVINKTESLRLDKELRWWAFGSDRVADKAKAPLYNSTVPPLTVDKSEEKAKAPKQTVSASKKRRVLGGYQADSHGQMRNFVRNSKFGNFIWQRENEFEGFNDAPYRSGDFNPVRELDVYNYPRSYDDFFDSIHRREDTYYVVSLSGDHFLLPAMVHNKTRRPLMSLLLPALSLNESNRPPSDHIALMQIDCEVVNTKLVHVKQSLLPHYGHTKLSSHSTPPPLPMRNQQHQKATVKYEQNQSSQTVTKNKSVKKRLMNQGLSMNGSSLFTPPINSLKKAAGGRNTTV